MLRNTFVLLRGIGTNRETSLWRSGVCSWKDFLSERRIRGISDLRKASMDSELMVASRNLASMNSRYFASSVPRRETWRCFGEFGRSVAFLDIETTGMSVWSPITVVGVYDGVRTHTLVRGDNLTASSLRAILGSVDLIVTYNGSGFDLPMITSQLPGCIPPVPHIDLRYPLRRLGLTGGLKSVERQLRVERDRRVEYMTGEDAVYLWKLWEKHGKRNALELLIEYNAEDCRNLKPLARHAYNELRRRTYEAALSHSKD